jgi:hypothetical protein
MVTFLWKADYLRDLPPTNDTMGVQGIMSELRKIMFLIAQIGGLDHSAGTRVFSVRPSGIRRPSGPKVPASGSNTLEWLYTSSRLDAVELAVTKTLRSNVQVRISGQTA